MGIYVRPPIEVFDPGSATQTGQDTGNASLASIDTKLTNPLPVSITSAPLPAGAATEVTLTALNAKVTAVNTGAVTVTSSALPTGASTATNQATANASLSEIAAANYATTATLTSIATSTTSAVLAAANAARKGLTIVNLSGTLYVAFAATASTSLYTLELATGAVYIMGPMVYRGVISARRSAGTGQAVITETV
jgi:hypothetical protein